MEVPDAKIRSAYIATLRTSSRNNETEDSIKSIYIAVSLSGPGLPPCSGLNKVNAPDPSVSEVSITNNYFPVFGNPAQRCGFLLVCWDSQLAPHQYNLLVSVTDAFAKTAFSLLDPTARTWPSSHLFSIIAIKPANPTIYLGGGFRKQELFPRTLTLLVTDFGYPAPPSSPKKL